MSWEIILLDYSKINTEILKGKYSIQVIFLE